MRPRILIYLLALVSASAQTYIVHDTRDASTTYTQKVPAKAVLIDLAKKRSAVTEAYMHSVGVLPTLPARVHGPSKCWSSNPDPAAARAEIKACREAQREPDETARAARRAWNAVGTNVMAVLGQPSNTGRNLLPDAMYSAIGNITNLNTRRDLNLRALTAELGMTRSQVERNIDVPWWWKPDEEDEE